MSTVRIVLANIEIPVTREDSVALAQRAIADAGRRGADIICFPECFVPGYRTPRRPMASPDAKFQQRAWESVARSAATANVAVILGTERILDARPLISALVIDRRGEVLGFQDKVQLDPSEEATYSAGTDRRLFTVGDLTFGIAICHEGWRYPETVRWAARRGAQVVFHPHFHEAEPGSYRPTIFADPANSFHEKAVLCRAAENNCWVATVNSASVGSPTTSAFVRPDGTLLSYQPYGTPGLLVADIDTTLATGLLASRLKSS